MSQWQIKKRWWMGLRGATDYTPTPTQPGTLPSKAQYLTFFLRCTWMHHEACRGSSQTLKWSEQKLSFEGVACGPISGGTAKACTDRKWDGQAQTGRKHSTVHSLMAYRHGCVTFMGKLQTDGILTATPSPSLLKKRRRGFKWGEESPCVHVRGKGASDSCEQHVTHQILATAGERRFTATSSWTRYSYLLNYSSGRAVTVTETE